MIRYSKDSRRTLIVVVLSTIMILSGTMILSHHARAASPSTGTLSQMSTSLSWQGQFFALGTIPSPSQCPANLDPLNLQCDHFFLSLNLPSDFWLTHAGSVTVTIQWLSGSNDFDLYVYRADGVLVGKSTLGGGETSEQVVLQNPLPVSYEIRVTPFLVTASSYTGSASLSFTAGGPSPNPTLPTGGIAFGAHTIIDPQRTEGEPLNHIDKFGNIWETGPWGFSTGQGFVAKSTDRGDSFHIVSPDGLRPNVSPAGGGDTDIITDDQGNAYFADLEGLADVGVGVSNDGGNNWRTNFLTNIPADDRQWLAVDNGLTPSASDNTIFLAVNEAAFGWQVLSSPGSTGSTDLTGGLVYTNAAGDPTTAATTDPRCGRLIFDPVNRMLYLPCNPGGSGSRVDIVKAHVAPGQRTGLQFSVSQTPTSPGGRIGLGRLFSDLAVDSVGNIYAVWIDINNNNVYLSASTNTGTSWTTPVQVNGDPANTNVMPWAVAGSPGIVDIVFYGTEIRGDPNSFPSWLNNRQAATVVKWFTYFVQVQAAVTSGPTIYQVRASEHPTDYGQICTNGLACTLSPGSDRTLADFFTLAIDSNGAARIVIDDLTNQHHGASLFELTQVAGPSAIGTTLTRQFPNLDTGVADPAGDAQVPHYSPLGAGPNQPSLDLRSVRLSQPDASRLTVTLTLQNLNSLQPPTGSTGLLWLTRWQFNSTGEGGEQSFRIFYLGANSTGGQNPVFFAGTGIAASPLGIPGDGCVTTTPQNCKIIVYPAEKAETGTIDRSTSSISITAPLSDIGHPKVGNILYSVTALTFAFTKGNPIYRDADATRAFDFLITTGQNTQCDVEGGGEFNNDSSGQKGHSDFALNEHCDDEGKVEFEDHGSGQSFGSQDPTIVIQGNTATITGVGFTGVTLTTFTIIVQDNGGVTPDTFAIILGTGYTASGALTTGRIHIS